MYTVLCFILPVTLLYLGKLKFVPKKALKRETFQLDHSYLQNVGAVRT